ncbi:hypothetical protein GCM10009737_03880 [Nocardioides lentus]|uniref:Uncharacterized protein n=1 Tax=Nocardioides lentus TaxID=338077 RepID=A0ABP5A7Z5_9ACTN
MTDPEVTYRRLVSGDVGAVRDRIQALRGVVRRLRDARDDIEDAARVPVWTGLAALAFSARATGLTTGTGTASTVVTRALGALDVAADAYDDCADRADYCIGFWRDRPDGMPAFVEEVFARVVDAALVQAGDSYGTQLAGVTAVLKGEDLDLDALDSDTRAWVERGLEQNEDWLEGNGSSLGPLIPNTAATGDDRGLTPQGLGYDRRSNLLLQGYYHADEQGSGLAMIDERTGAERGEVTLGGGYYGPRGFVSDASPHHAGGVTVAGDDVLVSDDGRLYTYSLSEMRQNPGGTVYQKGPSQAIDGGAYSTYKDGKLYVGEWQKNEAVPGVMNVYEKDATGTWVKTDSVPTPGQTQGVVVRDDEYVFSSSYGRHSQGSLIVHDRHTGEPIGDPSGYPLPTMSQGVVETRGGDLLTSYESGASKFSDPSHGVGGWWWGVPDSVGLWANPYMTRTPLDELGIGDDVTMEPATLDRAASDLAPSASVLSDAASELDGASVPSSALGPVPEAGDLTAAVEDLLTGCADSLRTGSRAVRRTAEELRAARGDLQDTDGDVARRMGPR